MHSAAVQTSRRHLYIQHNKLDEGKKLCVPKKSTAAAAASAGKRSESAVREKDEKPEDGARTEGWKDGWNDVQA